VWWLQLLCSRCSCVLKLLAVTSAAEQQQQQYSMNFHKGDVWHVAAMYITPWICVYY
jgi:hypothetical protein